MECNYEGANCKFCDIECEEKAPAVLPDETDASEMNQLHNTTNEKLLKVFIEMRERFQPLYRETGLISIEHGGGIMLTPEMFLKIFKEYDTSYFLPDTPEKLTAYYNGTKFFCIR